MNHSLLLGDFDTRRMQVDFPVSLWICELGPQAFSYILMILDLQPRSCSLWLKSWSSPNHSSRNVTIAPTPSNHSHFFAHTCIARTPSGLLFRSIRTHKQPYQKSSMKQRRLSTSVGVTCSSGTARESCTLSNSGSMQALCLTLVHHPAQ